MITNLLFLILILLLISLSPQLVQERALIKEGNLFAAAGAYCILIGAIIAESFLWKLLLKKSKELLNILVHLEILVFLCLYYFLFRVPQGLKQLSPLLNTQLFNAAIPLALYFFAYFIFHWRSNSNRTSSLTYAKRQLKILIPFAIPFLLFCSTLDLAYFASIDLLEGGWLSAAYIALFALIVMFFIPPVTCWFWECTPLNDPGLEPKLRRLCAKARFNHRGFKNWAVMDYAPTAAILGVFPSSRYILFTKGLLQNLSSEAIEAVLAHEIGHSKCKHLLILPFILFGLLLLASLSAELLLSSLPYKGVFLPLILFIFYAAITALYFRYVFGFFSRLFERQADLYCLKVGVPLKAMIEALHTVGVLTGNSHNIPNWHHFSIKERMEFLKKVEKDPSLERKHLIKVRKSIALFAVLFAFSLCGSYFLSSEFLFE